MTLWIVTVKLPKNPEHDPRNKKIGKCPIHNAFCSDITGRHHSILHHTENNYPAELVQKYFEQQYHVTRIEEAK